MLKDITFKIIFTYLFRCTVRELQFDNIVLILQEIAWNMFYGSNPSNHNVLPQTKNILDN